MIFDFHFDISTIIILCTCIVSALYIVIWGLMPMRKTSNYFKKSTSNVSSPNMTPIKASVIVYARNDENNIASYLDNLMQQKCVDFEVIVVNDASADHTAEIVESLTSKYPNLYMTFVPDDARSLSRRKLSLTLGMKAAKNEVVITTAANLKILSDYWLYNIVRHFEDPKIEITLGFSHIDKNSQKGFGRWFRSFDSLTTASLWLGYAINKMPYRGDGLNLAFRRKNFFDQNGYARTIYLQYGDDDLFINQFATGENTAVELSHDSQLSIDWGESESRLWLDRKEHYTFTAKYLNTKAFICQNILHISHWIMIIACIASCIFKYPNFAPSLIIFILLITIWGYQIYLYRRTAHALQSIRLWWSVALFSIAKPLTDAIYKIKFRKRRLSNFTHL